MGGRATRPLNHAGVPDFSPSRNRPPPPRRLNFDPCDFCRLCLDWTERAATHRRRGRGRAYKTVVSISAGRERMNHKQCVVVTGPGRHGFLKLFGISVPERDRAGTRGRMRVRIHNSYWLDTPDLPEEFEAVKGGRSGRKITGFVGSRIWIPHDSDFPARRATTSILEGWTVLAGWCGHEPP